MTGFAHVDTSVLVRYLVVDAPRMAARARRLLESEETLIVSEVALVETAFVLEKLYQYDRGAIVEALSRIIMRANIRLLHLEKTLAFRALQKCSPSRRVSFADAMIWALARTEGPATVYSFDRRFPQEGVDLQGPP